jgi:hypothetical protein
MGQTTRSLWGRRFARRIQVDPDTDCWLWTGALQRQGYGYLSIRNKTWRAHRVAWEIFNGKIPVGLHIHHTCGSKICLNPAHMVLMTPAEHSRLHNAAK